MSTPTTHLSRWCLAASTAAAAVALLAGAGPAAAQARAPAGSAGGSWGTAIEVPGTAALNQGFGYAQTASVSCPLPGNCAAGGSYTDSSGNPQAFVASETHGVWGTAVEVPGTAALNVGGAAGVSAVSCARAGNCTAGGSYADAQREQVFVVSQANGTWGQAVEVPGIAALNQGNAYIDSVSCASAGNCTAAGLYSVTYTTQFNAKAFVVSEVNGRWGTAEEVPGTAQGGFAWANSVSCAAAANCAAGGWYRDSSGTLQAFVVNETNGAWGTAMNVPGTAGGGQVWSVSCARAGNCAAGGTYADSAGQNQAFVVTQTDGSWGTANKIPGTAALNTGGYAVLDTMSCAPAAGDCAAGGLYTDSSGGYQAFVVSKTNGTWGKAIEVPGTATLNTGGFAAVNSVSCAPAGNCSAGGQYADSSGAFQAFVASKANGTWGTAEQVPGTAALNTGGYAQINSVSCAPVGTCAAGGFYTDGTGNQQAFVVNKPASQQPGPRQTAASPRHPPARPWQWRARGACQPVTAGSPARGPLLPLGPATASHCLIAHGGRWLLPGYPPLPR